MRNKSVHSHNFSEVPKAEIPRSSFDRSHGFKATFDAGRLVPFFIDEALPGDTFNLKTAGFARLATPIFPIMDNMYMDTHYFSIPYRLLWDNWERFLGEVDDPAITPPEYLIPQVNLGVIQLEAGDIGDYMGLPIGKTGLSVSALFNRAYRRVYNEWFRDQNLATPVPLSLNDGPDGPQDTYETQCAVRGKRHDYFTSCLPFPQKGPEVQLGLGGQAPVEITDPDTAFGANAVPKFRSVGISSGTGSPLETRPGEGTSIWGSTTGGSIVAGDYDLAWNDVGGLHADLSNASATTINDLREAFQIQKMYERDARGGTRYVELIKAHFGVTSPDARLQRSEYLGGGSTRVNISPIHSSAETDPTTGRPLGALSGVGTASFNNHGFTKSFTEHCVVLGIVSVRADLTYQQGIPRMFSRKEKFDFFWPALSHLGEQEVLNQEIFYQNDTADTEIFGYQERFGEYRYKPSLVTGEFRSDAPQSLDAWHLAEDFTSLPTLTEDFIRHFPPLDRCIAVPDEPHFIGDFHHNLRCARPMPLFGVPGNIDRF